MVISPDEGGTEPCRLSCQRARSGYGYVLQAPRLQQRLSDGRNPIVAHEFLGSSVEGKDVIIIDDMISSGESMIDVATELKKRKANRIFVAATFGLFTNGLERFDKAVCRRHNLQGRNHQPDLSDTGTACKAILYQLRHEQIHCLYH